MTKRRSYTDPTWHATLNALMAEVLRAPERYHPSLVTWAQWRRRWLAEHAAHREGGSNLCHDLPDTAARIKFSQAAADLMPGPLGE
jgi:hypothetical protein